MEIVLSLYHHIFKGKWQHFIYFLKWLFCLVEWRLFPSPRNLHSAFAWFHTDNKSTHLHLSEPCYKSPRSGEYSLLAGAKAQRSCSLEKSSNCCPCACSAGAVGNYLVIQSQISALRLKTSEIPAKSQAEVENWLERLKKKLKNVGWCLWGGKYWLGGGRKGYWFRIFPFGKSFGLVPPLPSTYSQTAELLPNHVSIAKVLHSFWSRWQRHLKLSLMPYKSE